jgi:hypothetical protein
VQYYAYWGTLSGPNQYSAGGPLGPAGIFANTDQVGALLGKYGWYWYSYVPGGVIVYDYELYRGNVYVPFMPPIPFGRRSPDNCGCGGAVPANP